MTSSVRYLHIPSPVLAAESPTHQSMLLNDRSSPLPTDHLVGLVPLLRRSAPSILPTLNRRLLKHYLITFEQGNILRRLKKLGTKIFYPRPTDSSEYHLSILVFTNLSKGDDYGQLGVLTGLLLGNFNSDEIYHPISCLSHKSKRPVGSVPAAEILASFKGIDEGNMIVNTYLELLGLDIHVD